jgi:MoxR-like ATPase
MDAKFGSTSGYIAPDDLQLAVNAAITLQRPLLVKGEPGTGKTELARQVAASLGMDLIEWGIKSTTKAQQGLYEYDAVARLRDSHLPMGAGGERVGDAGNYIRKGKLWQAFTAPTRVVLLIDEVDKADIEFPNDLLQELDRMEFHVYETGQTVRALHRPVVIITSNNEKDLPDAFLRRCFFHYIRFPDEATLAQIVRLHFPQIKEALLTGAVFRAARYARDQEETLNLRSAGLAETSFGGGFDARAVARVGQERPARAAWRAAENRKRYRAV